MILIFLTINHMQKDCYKLPDLRCSFGSKSSWDGVVSESGDLTFSLLDNGAWQDGELSVNNATTNGFSFSFSGLSCSVAAMTFAEEKTYTSLGQHTLFHGETLFVVSSGDTEDISIPFFTQSRGIYFSAHALFVKWTNLNFQKLRYFVTRNFQKIVSLQG